MGRNDYQKGMKAASDIYEEKYEQTKRATDEAINGIQKNFDNVLNHQEDIMEAIEEHDEQIDILTKYSNSIAEDKESLLKIGADNQKILLGIIVNLRNHIDSNSKQVKFYEKLRDYLEIEDPEEASFEILDTVEDIKAQRCIFRVICEYLFLINGNQEFLEDIQYKDWLSYFNVNERNKQIIINEVEQFYRNLGEDALINKYSLSLGGRFEPKVKTYPKLEVDMSLNVALDYPYISMDDGDEWLFGDDEYVCKSYSKCYNRVVELIGKYYRRANRYLDVNDSSFFGKQIAKQYGKEIQKIIAEIDNYISVNKIRIQIEELNKLSINCEQEILDMCNDEVNNNQWAYKLRDKSYYVDMVEIEESEDCVETLFGGWKDITTYDADYYDVINKIDEEINSILEKYEELMEKFIEIKIVSRIQKVCDEIKKAIPME